MHEPWLTDQIRSRVFVVHLPGMTRERERALIRRCSLLARTALAAGVPLTVAWNMLGERIEWLSARLRTEHERESFAAVMHRLRLELFQDRAYASR
ncbi:hypothetical protein [Paludisphaera borealis]|uniref:Uncharacterized protein n=1 Tax=Paludisphaera borealis TaxID=1387353 RepID=A0A1U7CVA3_9BACT|nr:hypothetical protein [Paludisphaera borealis]APW62862.1 hypothetical protein BSF38_04418 [Paludisphaera borealis]MDR3621997.1 hypothetical protein [Paludisphaera borealis]